MKSKNKTKMLAVGNMIISLMSETLRKEEARELLGILLKSLPKGKGVFK